MIPTHLTLNLPGDYFGNKVTAIKAIRGLTQLGLKETKDLSEQPGPVRVKLDVRAGHNYDLGRAVTAEENYVHHVNTLRSCGIRVAEKTEAAQQLVNDLRTLVCNAVLQGELDLAQSLLAVLREHG